MYLSYDAQSMGTAACVTRPVSDGSMLLCEFTSSTALFNGTITAGKEDVRILFMYSWKNFKPARISYAEIFRSSALLH